MTRANSSMRWVPLLAATLGFALAVQAQDFPTRPIRIIVNSTPGGGLDPMARIVADRFREKWEHPSIVEHRAGAAGNIGAEAVFKSAPDGYTLLISPPGPLVINKLLYSKLAYDSDAFVPVSIVVRNANVLIIHPRVPAQSLQEFIAYAKANPGKLNYGTPGSATTPHLTAELFASMTGTRIVHVPYKGAAPMLADLMGGQIEMTFSQVSNVISHIRAGTVRLLAVASEKRLAYLPDALALSEVLPGFASSNWFGIVAPPGTPPAIADRLAAAIAEAVNQPEVAKRLNEQTYEPVGSTPAEMARFMKQESERWGAVIRASGMKAD